MSRTRSRAPIAAQFSLKSPGGQWQHWPSSYNGETMWESSYPGSCNMTHTRVVSTLEASGTTIDGTQLRWTGFAGYIPAVPPPTRLDWGKLPTSSEFGIIQFFAELDDTLLLFTKKFWKELSYGSFTWGVLPFVSDIKALLTTVKNLSANLSSFDYEDQYEQDVQFDYTDTNGDNWKGTLTCKWRFTGKADMSFQNDASILLDRLGFHPDLATAWDLVPLSFVLDWVLPVGDFLEGLRGGGWVKVIYFNGWQTCKWSCRGTWTGNKSAYQAGKAPTCAYETEGFSRFSVATPLFVDSKVETPDFSLPSLKEGFNMAYIAGVFKKVMK